MRIVTGIIMLLCLFATAVAADTRIFDLRYRRAGEIAAVVQSALGDAARVSAVDRSLVVSAAPGDLAVAADLIGRLDRPPRMLRVTVGQDLAAGEGGSSVGVSGRVSSGSSTVIVGRPDAPPRGGATVIVGGDDRLRLDMASASHREVRTAEQFIVTLEGSPARISVGRRIPFAERWLVLARRHAQVVENVRYESVDTGFEVIPTLFDGGAAELVIHPFMAFIGRHGDREIRFSDLATTVRVRLGEWFDLGGTLAGSDEVSREILAAGNRSGGGDGSVRVRVELQPE